MSIELPEMEVLNREERERNIHAIIDVAMPMKKTLRGEIKRLLNTVGLKHAFCGVGDAIAAALIVSFGGLFTVSILSFIEYGNNMNASFLFVPIMLFAPILYFSMLAFTSWKERMVGTWKVIASCRYNLRYIVAIRTMLVSAAGMIFIPITTIPLMFTEKYPNIIAAAFCAMFLYSALSLLCLLISESLIFQFAAPVMWVIGWGVTLVIFTPIRVERFLESIPIAFSLVLIGVLLALYLLELRVFIMRSTRRVAHA